MTDELNAPCAFPIAEVRAGTGVIGMAALPGGNVQAAGLRDAGPDLGAVARWGATALVSLVEAASLPAAAGREFGDAVRRLPLDWHHLPIADMQVPDAVFERAWTYHGHMLRRRLQAGGRVLVHCEAGLGRSGMMAARLLVELGTDPETAIATVRAARPGAIETDAQAAHVRGWATVADDDHRGRVLGCLIGGAVGDAFGYPVEFLHMAQIRRRFGPEGIGGPVLNAAGLWVASDDTQMTLFTVEGVVDALAAGGDATEHLRAAYLAWLGTQQAGFDGKAPADRLASFRELWVCQAPGNTCLGALRRGGRGRVGAPINDSKGCGGVMRTAPIGLVRGLSPEQCLERGADAAALTHGHPSGYWSAGAIAAIVRMLVAGDTLETAVQQAMALLAGRKGARETVEALRLALDPSVSHVAALGGGWVGEEALAMGVHAVRRGRNLREVLMIAVNHDGDSDSTGSIAGQLWGARAGVTGIPVNWVDMLDVQAPLNHAAARLIEVA